MTNTDVVPTHIKPSLLADINNLIVDGASRLNIDLDSYSISYYSAIVYNRVTEETFEDPDAHFWLAERLVIRRLNELKRS